MVNGLDQSSYCGFLMFPDYMDTQPRSGSEQGLADSSYAIKQASMEFRHSILLGKPSPRNDGPVIVHCVRGERQPRIGTMPSAVQAQV